MPQRRETGGRLLHTLLAGVVALMTMTFAACVGDPDGNPIVDVLPTCGADSQDHAFFGEAFTSENHYAREQLAHFFGALSDHDEPSLACGPEPDEAYRLTAVAHYPNVPLLIRIERRGAVARLRAVYPAPDHTSYRFVPARIERSLSADEWRRIASAAEEIDFPHMRALPVPGIRSEGWRPRLIEFRRRGAYGLVHRPVLREDDAVNPLMRRMIAVAGINYPWFE